MSASPGSVPSAGTSAIAARRRAAPVLASPVLAMLAAACGAASPASSGPLTSGAPPTAAVSDDGLERGLASVVPSGWVVRTFPPADPAAPMAATEVELCRPSQTCTISYGGAGAVRTESPCVTIVLHPLADEAALHAAEETLRELSSHCPRDVELARSAQLFVAVSPCDRAYAIDPSCAAAAAELEAALRAYFEMH